MFSFLEYLLRKVIAPAKLKVVQSNAGTLPTDSSKQGQATLAQEAKLRELEQAYLVGNLKAKDYLDELARFKEREQQESNEEDEVQSEDGSVDDPEEAVSDESDWDDQDEDWFTVAGNCSSLQSKQGNI